MGKNLFLILVLFAFQVSTLSAQSYVRKTIKAGETLADNTYYLFPSFTDGTVKMKDGGKSLSKLNFNILLCQMQFVNEHGDTMNIADPSEIDSIILNDKSFFYKKGYYEILHSSDSLNLVVLRNVTYEPVKIGAMGLASHGGSIDSYTTLRDDNVTRQLVINQDINVVIESTYFLMNKKGEMYNATKSNFLSLFEKNKETIQGYLKANKTNYNKEVDLKKLFDFCSK